MKTYEQTLEFLGTSSPSMTFATPFIKWADNMSETLAFVYSKDYGKVIKDIVAAAKEAQDFSDD
jgi:hypothetical protein